ncbi:hypothetical protein PXK30_09735 [Phaeobacter gallaeciensis]|uniref:hypothetical protein n=1 Tax=Phaeobacter gallaeciensis TaxID=60890 RepID=UPI00237FBDFB|nr:hypothetical protein [Phaeobacter gallaeciensis]MDE4303596.1 hypothetical protein [Phaeobacter gallaeciensis]MDE4307922.1 hypothetical protein [Phaeobacter gallaeciensis]MDE4312380.1 hypothetical protein [Phaeobacter gallaeciensis]MDE4316851.1 hypothetical protein [Phaeobacter gallaeciensis]MDE4321314.1 hypothetical protein [Phaeobacter gallaeciensis]
MSRFIAALVYRKRIGSMARKSILAYCAERANDDGTGIWASKVRIANEVECSKQTVISTLNAFVEEGVMVEVGKRRSPHGYTIEYAINVSAVMQLEDAFEDPFSTGETRGPKLDGSNELTPRGQTAGPQEVKPVDPNRPRTVLKPSYSPKPPEGDDDLFSASGQPTPENGDGAEAKKPDSIEESFEKFWKAYPKKAGKPNALKAWKAAIKHADPDRIISGAERYAEWLSSAAPGEFRPQPKYPQGWLNDHRWTEFEDSANGEPREEDLSRHQHAMLLDGRVPPSMADDNGRPNAAAQYWLKKFGYGRAA